MSRRVIPRVGFDIIVGWDNGLQTFFYQVYDNSRPVDDSETPHFAAGYKPVEFPTAADMLRSLEKLPCWITPLDLPSGVLMDLEDDKMRARPLTEHQKSMLQFLGERIS